MVGRFAAACDLLASGHGVPLGVLCLAVAASLVTLIVLGFGPLRAWLAPTLPSRLAATRAGHWDDGLPGVWRLYRQVRSAHPPAR